MICQHTCLPFIFYNIILRSPTKPLPTTWVSPCLSLSLCLVMYLSVSFSHSLSLSLSLCLSHSPFFLPLYFWIAVSSVHALVTPLLSALRDSGSTSQAIAATDSMGGKGALIGRIGERKTEGCINLLCSNDIRMFFAGIILQNWGIRTKWTMTEIFWEVHEPTNTMVLFSLPLLCQVCSCTHTFLYLLTHLNCAFNLIHLNSNLCVLIKSSGEALQRVALGLSRNTSVTAPELLLYLHATLQPFVLTVVKEKENQKRVKGMLDRPKIAKDDAGDDLQDEFITFVSLSYRASFVDNRERSYIIQRKPILWAAIHSSYLFSNLCPSKELLFLNNLIKAMTTARKKIRPWMTG